MPGYYGDIAEDQTIRIPFNTFSSDDPSASVTVTDLVAGDVKVHKDGATAPITTDGATISLNHNAVNGAHYIIIDTSADAAYSTGSDYDVRLEGITVDTGELNAWVGSFSIENRFMRGTDLAALATALATAQLDLDTLTGSDGVTLATAQGNYAPNVVIPATKAEMDTAHGLLATEAKQDIIDLNVDQLETAIITNAAGVDIAADIIALKAETVLIVADTNELQVDNIPGLIGTAQADLDTITGSDGVTLATAQGLYAPNVVVPDAAGVAPTASEINTEVDTALTDIHLDHLMAAAAADVIVDGSVIAHMVSATEDWSTFVPSTDALEAVRDRGDAAWITGGGSSPPTVLQTTTIATLATQVSFTLTAGSADDDAYNGMIVIVEDQATATQKAVGVVSDYTGTSKTVTLKSDPGIFVMATGDTIDVVAVSPVVSTIQTDLDTITGSDGVTLATAQGLYAPNVVIPATKAEMDTAHGLLATEAKQDIIDTNVDDIETAVITNAAGVDIAADIIALKAETVLIVADTGELQTDNIPGLIGTAQADLDTITGSDGVTLATAQALYAPNVVIPATKAEMDTAHGLLATEAKQDIIDTNVDDIETAVITNAAGVDIAADIIAIKAETVLIVADTGELQADDVPGLIAALNNLAASDVLTTALTESYGTDGSTQTLAQLLYLINAAVSEFTISGTTKTTKKLDGATTAATYTLNDGTNPTGITRAT